MFFSLDFILAPVVIGLTLLSAFGLGSPVVRFLDRNRSLSDGEHAVIAGLIGAYLIAHAVWLVGAWDYSRASMAGLIGLFLIVAGLMNNWRFSPLYSWITLPETRLWKWVPLATAAVILVGFIGAFAPPSDHDTLRYHLLLPHRDLAWGRIAVYFGWSVYEFSPPLGGMLTRLVYALGGPSSAQLLHLTWEIVCAGTTAAIAGRMGLKPQYCWLAALFLLSQRVSINLASTASNEFILAAYAGGTLIVAQHFISEKTSRAAVLLGLIVGGLCAVKLHGFVFAVSLGIPLLASAALSRVSIVRLVWSALTATVLVAPFLIQNVWVTGNPVFPAFNQMFGPDHIDVFGTALDISRSNASITNYLTLPWDVFVNQNRFDGLQFGIPVLLLFLPFALLAKDVSSKARLFSVCLIYLCFWVTLMPQFIRFLVPLFPILCVLSACGARVIGLAVEGSLLRRRFLITLAAGLALAQSGFLAATASYRIPPALGLIETDQHLNAPAFRYYAHYTACKWVLTNLKPGESYLAALNSPTYYCPPERALSQLVPGDEAHLYTTNPLPPLTAKWFSDQLEACRTRFVIIAGNLGTDAEPHVFAKHRYDDLLKRGRAGLKPVVSIGENALAHIFDARDLAAALRTLSPPPSKPGDSVPKRTPKSDDCQLLKPYKPLPWPTYN